jgi:lipase maturation factor 1
VSGGGIPEAKIGKTGLQVPDFGRFVTVENFLRALGAIYLIAFVSFGVQAIGLIGNRGIVPLREYVAALREAAGGVVFHEAPMVFWWGWSDGAIRAVWILGAIAAAVAFSGRWQRVALGVCLVLWISVCVAGQDFLSFQWDILLSEAGFLALFASHSRIVVWLFRWLIFRLMFFSGVVKLTSGDPTWRNLTAMHYHYETQPLPNPVAWYMDQLPMTVQKFSTAFTFFAELLLPLLFFAPKPVRRIAAGVTIALQLLILTTGNFTFFNWLAIALCMWLFIEPRERKRSKVERGLQDGLAAFIAITTGLLFLEVFGIPLPPGGGAVLHAVAPLRIVNSYGLFAVMTTERPEIIVEGSNDGVNWAAYEFRYKPGDVHRAPPIVAPHQPRLDWQMWFAALGSYQQNRWFVNFVIRLLQGEPTVVRLLAYNPFPNAPPKYIRAQVFLYRFTTWGSRDWWEREDRGLYLPPVSLK